MYMNIVPVSFVERIITAPLYSLFSVSKIVYHVYLVYSWDIFSWLICLSILLAISHCSNYCRFIVTNNIKWYKSSNNVIWYWVVYSGSFLKILCKKISNEVDGFQQNNFLGLWPDYIKSIDWLEKIDLLVILSVLLCEHAISLILFIRNSYLS